MSSMLPSDLLLPGHTRSGCGSLPGLLPAAAEFGLCGVLVHGRSLRESGRRDALLAAAPEGLKVLSWEHGGGEPELEDLRGLLTFARSHAVDWVAGVGGGSVLDLAKACAGLLAAQDEVEAYHDGKTIPASATPFLAAPTTAGTGSEATPVCVLTNGRTGVKKSFRHVSFMARRVFLDGEPVAACPSAVIAGAGMDALTQAVEAYSSRGGTRLSGFLALEGLRLIAARLEEVFAGGSPAAAQELLEGSALAGMALANARLGIVHGLAHPLGARFGVPHGLACAVCLPLALAFNREAMGEDSWAALSAAAGGDIARRVATLLRSLKLASPFTGRRLNDRAAVVAETLASGSTAANPRPVRAEDVEWFLDRLFAG